MATVRIDGMDWDEYYSTTAPCGFTAPPTAMATVDIPNLIATVERMKAEKKIVDDVLVAALKDMMRQMNIPEDTYGIIAFAAILRVSCFDLDNVLKGTKPPSGAMWNAVRRWVEAIRGRTMVQHESASSQTKVAEEEKA